MILINSVKKIIKNNQSQNPLYLRNLIKEQIQNYLLNFIYTNNDYNQLIFTGGTCLRKVYGLNRLSEDLDFDFLEELNLEQFALEVKKYFKTTVGYSRLDFSISGNQNTIYFKLPLLKQLDVYSNRTPEDIFVRCDFSKEVAGSYQLDQNMITASPFEFFTTSYDLPTLFANKLTAFLTRSFYKGKLQKIPFKGRDIYDLYWLTQLSAKSSFEVKINSERLQALLPNQTLDQIKTAAKEKISKIDDKFLYQDLLPLIESRQLLEGFINSYQDYLKKYLDFVI